MNRDIQALLREAAEWRLIGLLFECPEKDWKDQVTAVANEITDTPLRAAATVACAEATEALYHTTFGPGGPAAAREVSYRETLLPGQLLVELAAYYRAFAYQPALPEPPDHVAVEAGFVGYLRLKEAYAVTRADTDRGAVTADAARQFIDDHLSFVAEPLSVSLLHSGIVYLSQAGAALRQRVGPCRKAANAPARCATDAECGGGEDT